jgi:hypothetical protein
MSRGVNRRSLDSPITARDRPDAMHILDRGIVLPYSRATIPVLHKGCAGLIPVPQLPDLAPFPHELIYPEGLEFRYEKHSLERFRLLPAIGSSRLYLRGLKGTLRVIGTEHRVSKLKGHGVHGGSPS